jgi:excisionase family DNA binding protein
LQSQLEPLREPAHIPAQWLTAAEAAQHLRVETRTILSWARHGKVKAYALSGTKRHAWRFLRVDLDAMLYGPSAAKSERIQ